MRLGGIRKVLAQNLPQSIRAALERGIKMLKPSKRHFLRYDAQTYETQGFINLCGIPLKMHNDTTKDQRFAKEPRFWQVTATPITTDGQQLDRTHIKFKTPNRVKLGELAPVINEHIFSLDDFLEKCVSVIVCARVMTEGGV